jgi:F-type H+-transporting ATPase subunit epsilon
MAKLHLDIVTAERRLVSEDDVDEVIAPGTDGQLGILPMHAALVTTLAPGELRVKKGGEETAYALTGGFMEVLDDKVVVLADAAERADEIDIARAQEARRRAEETISRHEAEVDLAMVEAALRRSLARLRVAERRRRGGGGPPRV